MPHTLIIPDETRVRLVEYLAGLQAGSASAGKRLRDNLAGIELATLADCRLNREGYYGLYERRLLPVFQHVNDSASVQGKQALLTIPGLGCGQFAGPFAGQLGTELKMVLERFLTLHGASFPQIKAVYFDPYSQCSNSRQEIHGISLMVRPLLQGNAGKSQLCQPSAYAEASDDFSDCTLFSIVAWDHVSWPGNDYFGGSRCTCMPVTCRRSASTRTRRRHRRRKITSGIGWQTEAYSFRISPANAEFLHYKPPRTTRNRRRSDGARTA